MTDGSSGGVDNAASACRWWPWRRRTEKST